MRRVRDLWLDICSMDNLRRAAIKACSSRKDKVEVASFLNDSENKLLELREVMLKNEYHSSSYRMFTAYDRGKKREIADLPLYPDRIVHWAVALIVEPILDRRVIPQSHASRKGHGSHSAVKMVQRYIEEDKGNKNGKKLKYALKMDVKKFFPSIPKDGVKQMIRRYIKDPDLLLWFDRLIDEYHQPGIAIGNRLSPLLANLYLSRVDHAMKQVYHCHYYVRYMDDIVILGYSKQWLHKMRKAVSIELEQIGLTLKNNWQVFPIDDRGIDFVGYRIFTTHTLLRTRTKLRMRSKCSEVRRRQKEGIELDKHDLGVIASYNGVLRWCNSRKLRRRTLYKIERDLKRFTSPTVVSKNVATFFNRQLETTI